MDNLSEKELEIVILAAKSRLMFYFSGISLGSAVTFFLLDVMVEQITLFSLGGLFMLMGALGFYQYSSHLAEKLLKLSLDSTKWQNLK